MKNQETEEETDVKFYMIRYFDYLCELSEYFCDARDVDEAITRFKEDCMPQDPPNKFTVYEMVHEQ